ncbi:hypothetical protein [Dyadobacter tibetensis]|uniref:hypothetical protein n=1 Tax=Dyadobacter tibetensis TaxID=1211851 RepID=UPI0004708162|nr:hypothetical protein [Dyadobacter tibetensis]
MEFKSRLFYLLSTLIIILVIGLHFAYLYRFSLNIPNGDDFYCIYDFLIQYNATESLKEKILLVITPWLEHTIAYTKLLAVINESLLGELNFKAYIFSGNLSLLGIFSLFALLFRRMKFPVTFLVPVALLLFQPQSFEGLYWPAATAAYMSVIFYSFLAVYLACREGRYNLYFAMLAGTMALYTFGAGIMVIPVILLVLLLKTDYIKALKWAVWSAVILFVFLYFYVYPESSRPPIFESLFNNPGYVFNYFFAFMGMTIDFAEANRMPSEVRHIITYGFFLFVSLATLLLLRFIWILQGRKKQSSAYWTLVGFALIIMGGTASMALLRGQSEMIYIFSSRYKIYPAILTVLVYSTAMLYYKDWVVARVFPWLAIGLSGVFFIVSYYQYTYKIKELRDTFEAGAYNWHASKQWLVYRETAYYEKTSEHFSKLMDKPQSPYHIPSPFQALSMEAIATAPVQSGLKIYEITGKRLMVGNEQAASAGVDHGQFVFLASPQKIYLFPMASRPNAKKDLLLTGNWFKEGYFGLMNMDQLLPSRYQIGEFNSLTKDIQLRSFEIEVGNDYLPKVIEKYSE